MNRLLKFFGWYFAASGFAAIVWLLLALPNYPKSLAGWMLLFLLALPVTLAVEFIGECLFKNRVEQQIEEGTKSKSVSILRIGYALLIMIPLIALAWAMNVYFGVT